MPEVLRVIARLNLGGPARHVLRLTELLAARGWTTVLATGRTCEHEPELLDEAHERGVQLVQIPGLGRAPRPLDDLRALAALRSLVAARRPAVVHTHTAKAGVLGRLAALSVRPAPALVHTYHGHVLSGYFGPWASRACRLAEAALARGTDRLIAVAARVRDELLNEHGVGRPSQYLLVPPGIDPERTAPDRQGGARLRAELGVEREEVLFGILGRLEPIKDVDLALAGWQRAAPRSRLLVMGDGQEGPRLRERLARCPGAHWLPPRRELGAVWGALDALILSSRREGLPQIVVEALAAGVPVVATRVGGLPELVRDGVEGLLVEAGDEATLAAALRRIACDADLRAALAAAARRRDLSEHLPAAVASRLADCYDELLLGRPLERAPSGRHAAIRCGS